MRPPAADGPVQVVVDEMGEGASERPTPRGRHRGLWWVGAGVLVVLVAAVGVVNVVQARREDDRRAALAEQPWVLPRLDDPLTEVWRSEASGWAVGETTTAVLLQASFGGALQALDAETGNVLWEITDAEGGCWPAGPWTGSPSGAPTDLLACTVFEADATGAMRPTVVGYDARTGRRFAAMPTPDGTVMSEDFVGADLLTVTLTDDGGVSVTLTDLRTGEPRWTFDGPPSVWQRVFVGSTELRYDDDVVYLHGLDDLVLSRRTGEPVSAARPALPPQTLSLADGGFLAMPGGWGLGYGGVEVLDDSGAVRFTSSGRPAFLGFVAWDVLVVERAWQSDQVPAVGALVGLDLDTGAELWSRPGEAQQTALVAIGDVGVVLADGTATGIDLETGADLWQHPADGTVTFREPVTDGRVVLLPVRTAGALDLVAVDLETGEDRWRMPAPEWLREVSVVRGLVLMDADGEVIAFRP